MSLQSRPRRSALYLPASNAKAIAKARTLDCDLVILDLEDAVAPDAKALARDQAVAAIREGGFGARELLVRVNGLDTDWGETDLESIAPVAPDGLLLPKISTASDIAAYAHNPRSADIPLWAMIETAMSLMRLNEICASAGSSRLRGLVMGTNDLAKELGARPGVMRAPLLGALGLAVTAARAYELVILDGVFNDINNEIGFSDQARQAVEFGFDGKTLIHPNQIGACNAAFTPDAEAVSWAQRIIAAFAASENADKGAIRLDGRMVERLHLHEAHRTLAAAGQSKAQS